MVAKKNARVVAALYRSALGHEVVVEKIIKVRGVPRLLGARKRIPPNRAALTTWLKCRDPRRWRDMEAPVELIPEPHRTQLYELLLDPIIARRRAEIDDDGGSEVAPPPDTAPPRSEAPVTERGDEIAPTPDVAAAERDDRVEASGVEVADAPHACAAQDACAAEDASPSYCGEPFSPPDAELEAEEALYKNPADEAAAAAFVKLACGGWGESERIMFVGGRARRFTEKTYSPPDPAACALWLWTWDAMRWRKPHEGAEVLEARAQATRERVHAILANIR